MSGSTTRLGLYLPGGGSTGLWTPDETADIDKINQNMQKLDDAVGAKGGLSTARPATPYPGQLFRETDTGRLIWWDATSATWVDAEHARSHLRLKNTNQTVNNSTWTALAGGWGSDSPNTDIGGIVYSAGTLTAPVKGLYLISAGVTFDGTGNTVGGRICRINLPGGVAVESPNMPALTNSNPTRCGLTYQHQLLAGEAISVSAYQNSGVTATVIPDPACYMQLTLLKAL